MEDDRSTIELDLNKEGIEKDTAKRELEDNLYEFVFL